jgi:DNA integrity scanning protein DisA with diadenylate cyclase activity
MIGEWFARLGDFFSRAPAAVAIDLVDIALVAYVIYRVLLLIKGTRAMQMGLGLALVFALYQAARIFELVTLFTMMDSLITYVVQQAVAARRGQRAGDPRHRGGHQGRAAARAQAHRRAHRVRA